MTCQIIAQLEGKLADAEALIEESKAETEKLEAQVEEMEGQVEDLVDRARARAEVDAHVDQLLELLGRECASEGVRVFLDRIGFLKRTSEAA
jgi:septal ring factor EnvC (AmiA/AmiB activator)